MSMIRGKLNAMRIGLVVLTAAAALVATRPAHATIMTFDLRYSSNPSLFSNNLYWGSSAAYLPYFSAYGDHVTSATQNVVMPYPQPSPTTTYNVTYNYTQGNAYTPNVGVQGGETGATSRIYDVTQWPRVLYPGSTGASVYFVFTPDAGYQVKVNSFDVYMSYNTSTPESNTAKWSLFQSTLGGTVVASSNSTGQGVAGGPASNFTYAQTAPVSINTNAGYSSLPLVLQLNYVSGVPTTIAIDNINFDQIVPEPASLALLSLGLVLAVPRRRRPVVSHRENE